MKVVNSSTLAILAIATMITILQPTPTTAGLSDIVRSISAAVSNCRYSSCSRNPRCSVGYRTVRTTHTGCRGLKQKKYCCAEQCYFTHCYSESKSCPVHYRALDSTKGTCFGSTIKKYCCKTTDLPNCFDMSCPDSLESVKSCPSDYVETRPSNGTSARCGSTSAERLTCCRLETKTTHTADGSSQRVTDNQTHRKPIGGFFKNFFSNSHSPFAAFFQILILIPVDFTICKWSSYAMDTIHSKLD
ncbi:hypothetical protein Bhyg_15061 [Pseudolycoriella hygida]|uniref:Uncharacterized protein n=1 Tax=Pseudolycoriella hygida TaxID=35572 RepID=A0A9Q0MR56_9DIPT|nr:hypothetical protein Bhyg_15061 [Pseudolycoriella hygida]